MKAAGITPWSIGLGEANVQTMITGDGYPDSLVANTIIANIPQAVFSILYFSSNGVYSSMTLAQEWSHYAFKRKGLRVSMFPQGSQRSTYFLSLPYRYSIPLLGVSALLHWLISQSLYLVNIKAYGTNLLRQPVYDSTTCGYSPMAIVTTLSVGVALIICLVVLSFKRFKSGMPVAGSCSLAIAAACHPPTSGLDGGTINEDSAVDTLPVKWGVVKSVLYGRDHCSFSSGEVELPQDGWMYE